MLKPGKSDIIPKPSNVITVLRTGIKFGYLMNIFGN